MRLTDRDRTLVRDVALSHLLSRDQVVALGYFTSISRANVRLKQLTDVGLLKLHLTPFHRQHLYVAGPKASEVVGARIAALIAARRPSPQFLQHALAVTNIRVALRAKGSTAWRFEPQLRHEFTWKGRTYDVRPDGLAFFGDRHVFIEADLGHVCRTKFAEKIAGYASYANSGTFAQLYAAPSFEVLTVTTGSLRKGRLASIAAGLTTFRFLTFEELGFEAPGGWR